MAIEYNGIIYPDISNELLTNYDVTLEDLPYMVAMLGEEDGEAAGWAVCTADPMLVVMFDGEIGGFGVLPQEEKDVVGFAIFFYTNGAWVCMGCDPNTPYVTGNNMTLSPDVMAQMNYANHDVMIVTVDESENIIMTDEVWFADSTDSSPSEPEQPEEHVHEYVAGETVTPTCTTDGYTVYTCSCGDSYNGDIVAATGHSYEETVIAPTCTNAGKTVHTCSVCGHSYEDSEVPATGHSYAVDTVVEATCTTAGKTTYKCSVCGDTYDEVIEVLGHSYTSVVVPPEFDTDGYTLHTCERCGDSYKDNYVEAPYHKKYSVSATWMRSIAEHTRRLNNIEDMLDSDEIDTALGSLNITLQEKSIEATTEEQIITPDDGFYGLSSVRVLAVSGGTGSSSIPSAEGVEF